MNKYRELWEQVRDLKLKVDDIPVMSEQAEAELMNDPLVLERKHVIHALKRCKQERLSQDALFDWVHEVWFSDFFTPYEDDADCIESVMALLEELDEEDYIMPEDLDDCLEALENNRQVEGLCGDDL